MTESGTDWLERIERRVARIAVIGQGYVGLPLAIVFEEAGFPVTGFDVDPQKVQALNEGRSYIKHIRADRVQRAVASGGFAATTDFDRLRDCDAIVICVPTPLGRHREPNMTYINDTGAQIAKRLRKGQLVILESTTYPGTTDEELLPMLEASGLSCPRDFLLAFSPEREDPGNASFSTKSIPKVVGGVEPRSTEVAAALYAAALDRVVSVSSSRVAESCKLLENVFRSVNIALVNELKVTFEKMGIDVWEVIEAAKTKPFGFMPFYPGPGLGGHCIPLDPFYLSWKAAEYGAWTRFIELAGQINTQMPEYVISRTAAALNDAGKALRGARVCVMGLAYKANIDDDRESPSYELLEMLQAAGAEVAYCDPYFPVMKHTRRHALNLSSLPLTSEALSSQDALLISTAHDVFRDPSLYRGVKLIVDTRNLIASLGAPIEAKVVRA